MTSLVSIVINTVNRIKSLPTTLESLQKLRYPKFEIIVVNGPSTDGTEEYLLENWQDKIKLCHCPEFNLGMSRNIGIRNSSGDIICFIDDDGIPEPDWLDEIVNTYDDPSVGAVGGFVRDHTGVKFQTKYIASSTWGHSYADFETERDLEKFINKNKNFFPGLIGVNCSFRRAALESVLGYDEEYCYFLDETDVVYRLFMRGWKIKINPNAEVHHKTAPSSVRNKNKVIRSYTEISKSLSYYIIKNNYKRTSFLECFNKISAKKRECESNVDFAVSEKQFSVDKGKHLKAEIELGSSQGVIDAFKYPNRKLMSPTDFENSGICPLIFNDKISKGRKLRIALISDIYPPLPCGGVAVSTYELATELSRKGHEVTVITFSTGDHTVDFEEGVWVHRISPIAKTDNSEDVYGMPPQLAYQSIAVREEIKRINSHRRLDYVFGMIWDLNLAATIKQHEIPVGMYLVTSYKLMLDSKPEWIKNKQYYNGHVLKMIEAEKMAIRDCTTVFASTNAILRDFETGYDITIPKEKLKLIPFGLPDKKSKHSFISVNKEKIEILFVGRLEKRKGIETFLKVIPDLASKYANCCFKIVGNDSLVLSDGQTYRQKFTKEYSNEDWFARVTFSGEVSEEDLLSAYENCDIFVAPSLYESFGLIYLEGMRAGKPCIGCNAGGIPEVIQDKKTGLIVEPDSPAELAEAISLLVDNPQMRKEMGLRGRKLYEEKFSEAIFAQRIEDSIFETLNQVKSD